jgi:hypothetical protein
LSRINNMAAMLKIAKVLDGTLTISELLSKCCVQGAAIVKATVNFVSKYVGGGGRCGGGGGGGGGSGDSGWRGGGSGPDYSAALASLIGQLSVIQLWQNQGKSMVGELSSTVKSGFEQLNKSFAQVLGELVAIDSQLAGQREAMAQILEVVTDLRYKAGIERIEAAYRTLMKGSHNLRSTLEELKGCIFYINIENSQNLDINKVREYLARVRREKGKQAAEKLGSYVVTVKAQYLIIVTLYYSYDEDHTRVQQEFEDFNRDAVEIIKDVGLADYYDGEKRDGLKHGKGSLFYKSGDRYEGEWKDDMHCGRGKYTRADGAVYEGAWLNNKRCGQGKLRLARGNIYEGEFLNDKLCGRGKYTWPNGEVHEGEYLNDKRCGQGKYTWPDGRVYEGEYLNDKRCGQGKLRLANGNVYEGEFLNDMFCGQGKYTHANGQVYEGEYLNDMRCGQGKLRLANGDVYEGEFLNDKRCGQGKYTWANGDIYEGAWLNSMQHGQGKKKLANGKVEYEGEWKNDSPCS